MDLKTLWKIIRRWWWLALLPAVIVGAVGLLTYQRPATSYGTQVRLTVGLPPVDASEDAGFDPLYYSWLTSEYITGSLSDWVSTGEFVQAVADEMQANGSDLLPAAMGSDYVRSTLVIFVSGGDPAQVEQTAEAAVTVLQTRNSRVFPQLGGENATLTALDDPAVGANPPGLRSYLELVIRLGLGVALGVVLMFAAWFFDPYLRDADEAAALGWRVVGSIPKER